MADSNRGGLTEKDVDQAITALKKGAQLLKYGRRGKPKFCPFRLSNDESTLLWYSGKDEKQLKLCHVSKIIPGQRTSIFQRYPRPEKEYQSFSLICSDRSLDLICKDKDEAEVWFTALKALTTRGISRKWRIEGTRDSISSDSPHAPRTRRNSPSTTFDLGDTRRNQVSFENIPQNGLAKAFSDIITYTAISKSNSEGELVTNSLSSLSSNAAVDNSNGRTSGVETFRVSLSSAVSSSSQGSCREDFDALGDVYMWGQGIGETDALIPKELESPIVLDVHNIACGERHTVLVTKQGEIFSWGEESGGRLGHGVEANLTHPKLIDTLSGMNIEQVACSEYHTCAVTFSGDLYTWGGCTHKFGLLGHGSEVSHWIPKKVCGDMEGIRVSYISCGPWHTAVVTFTGQLFTFGDGAFGALGHGDRSSVIIPREVETLKGFRTIRVACGIWHSAAVVDVSNGEDRPGKLFTWGDGDKGKLGHCDRESKLIPCCVILLASESFCQVACGNSLTIALTTSGKVHTMGSTVYGQLGNPKADGKVPTRVEGEISNSFVEQIVCGSHHCTVLTSKTEVYTWGKGNYGQLGHGDTDNRNSPTLVNYLKHKQVKSVVCGTNFTAAICIHKWSSNADRTICSGCHNLFGFRRKRHNCYNCGLVFCKACSNRKSLKASLAPNMNKPYRVCDDCFNKIKKAMDSGYGLRLPKIRSGSINRKSSESTGPPRLPGQISRFLSVGSLSQNERQHSKCDNHVFPISNGRNFHVIAASVPGSRTVSRSTSPITTNSSPLLYATPKEELTPSPGVVYSSKQTNEGLSQEIANLRAHVEGLTRKTQQLGAQIKKREKQLNEVTAIATDEAEKCKAANEVIKSLTAQLKKMAEKSQENHFGNGESNRVSEQKNNDNILNVNESLSTSLISHESEPNGTLVNMGPTTSLNIRESEFDGSLENIGLTNGTSAETKKREKVVQAEPGVYVTLSIFHGGVNELKRVRFSRNRFTEEQAEKWWSENGGKVCERLNVRSAV